MKKKVEGENTPLNEGEIPSNESFLNENLGDETTGLSPQNLEQHQSNEIVSIQTRIEQIAQINKLLAHREKFMASKEELNEAKKVLNRTIGMEMDNPFLRVSILSAEKSIVNISYTPLVLEILDYVSEIINKKIDGIDLEIMKMY